MRKQPLSPCSPSQTLCKQPECHEDVCVPLPADTCIHRCPVHCTKCPAEPEPGPRKTFFRRKESVAEDCPTEHLKKGQLKGARSVQFLRCFPNAHHHHHPKALLTRFERGICSIPYLLYAQLIQQSKNHPVPFVDSSALVQTAQWILWDQT